MNRYLPLLVLTLFFLYGRSQPFVDVVSLNHQTMHTRTKNDSFSCAIKNTSLGILLPLKVDSGNYFLIKMNGEILQSSLSGYKQDASARFQMALIGLGWQHSFNTRLSFTALVLPKITSDFKDRLNNKDFQCGGSLLFQYQTRPNRRYKAGLYYNREPFGNFFVPLLGADIQLNKKNWIYGQLPLYFRYEHRFSPRFYSGLGLRFFGRSYRLNASLNHDYMFLQENQVKWFGDFYIRKKFVLYGEIGRSIAYGFKRYANNEKRTNRIEHPLAYTKLKDGFFFNLGFAYRIRQIF